MMKVNVVLLSLFGTLQASLALAETDGNWTVGAAQGWTEYAAENGPGNEFRVTCDVGYTFDGQRKQTNVSVTIVGRSPPPNTTVKIFVDVKEF
jgi:hypothetical protein